MNIQDIKQLKLKVNQSVYGMLSLIFVLIIVFIIIFQLQNNEIKRLEGISANYHIFSSGQVFKISRSIDLVRLFYLYHNLEHKKGSPRIASNSLSPLIMEFTLRDKINALRYEVNKHASKIHSVQQMYALSEFETITLTFKHSHTVFDAALAKLEQDEHPTYQQIDSIVAPLIAVTEQLSRLHAHANQEMRVLIQNNKYNNFLKLAGLMVVLVIIGVVGVFKMLGFVNKTLLELTSAQKEIIELNEGLELRVQQRTEKLEDTLLLLTKENEQRRFAEEQARKASNAKSDFLSRMSHELRTPMNAILGFGQLLELDAEKLTEPQNKNVEEILDAGNHLLILINEVLDLSKIESGKVDILLEKVSIDHILKQSMSLIRISVEKRKIELIDNISGKGYLVNTDETHLKQVLLNLLSNAVKYNKESGEIILDGEVIGDNMLRISVTDQGKGLSEDDIKQLFKPFERLNVVENVEGTGIGLVITKHLIELMGGSIGAESKVGEGASFWVELELV